MEDGELDEGESDVLNNLFTFLGLDPVKSSFIDKVVPSHYVTYIRQHDALPPIGKPLELGNVILKRDEVLHFSCPTSLYETKTRTGWVGGSSGFSFRVAKGVSYRVGGSRGYVTKTEYNAVTSNGTLIITNKRLFLHPDENLKPVSIPINKILSYNWYDDGVVVYKDGREKFYLFAVNHRGEAETIGICLGFLCSGT